MQFRTAITWTVVDLKKAVWHFYVNRLAASYVVPRVVRYLLLRAIGLRIQTPAIQPGLRLTSRNVRIGRSTFVNYDCSIYCGGATVTIGDNVQLAMNVLFLTDTHALGPPENRCGAWTAKPIHIGDGCWIGANVIVMPGVTIGEGCVVGAGAIVTRDCQPNGLYVGNPARRIRDLDLPPKNQ